MQTISVFRNGISQKSQDYSDGEMLVMQTAADFAVVIGSTGEILGGADNLELANEWATLASIDMQAALEAMYEDYEWDTTPEEFYGLSRD